jgi:hypothetical protein
LIGDAGALARSGESETSELLALTSGFANETSSLVWQQIIDSLHSVRSPFAEDPVITQGLKNFVLKLVSPAVESVGWESLPSDDLLTTMMRSDLLSVAGIAGHKEVIAEAQRRFKLWKDGNTSAINPNLRGVIFSNAVRHGGADEYEILKKAYQTDKSVDGKPIILVALGRIQNLDLMPDFLDFLVNKVPIQDIHSGIASLAGNVITRMRLWEWFQENFDSLHLKLSGNLIVWERFVQSTLTNFSDFETERQIAAFFEGKDIRGYDRVLGILSDTIKNRATYKERDGKAILEWLNKNGYA